MTRGRNPTIIDVVGQAGIEIRRQAGLQSSASVRDETRAAVRQSIAHLAHVDNRADANVRTADVGLIGLRP